MKKLPLSLSLLTYLDEAEYTEAALAAHPQTSALATPFQACIQAWDGVFAHERQGRRAVTRAEAVVAVRDSILDDTTIRAAGWLLAECGQNRKHPLFLRVFTLAPSELVRLSLRKQAEHIRDTLLPEVARLPETSPVRGQSVALSDASQGALAALDARAAAKGARGVANGEVDEWKEGVNRLRLGTYADLLKLASQHGQGKGWADAFFRSDSQETAEVLPDARPATPDLLPELPAGAVTEPGTAT
jgi:hypothetical protein